MLRAFIGQLDRTTLLIFALGAGIGLTWLLVLLVGVAATGLGIVLVTILMVMRARWFDIGVFMFANGLVPSIGYAGFGRPDVPPQLALPDITPTVPIEALAPGIAMAFVLGGVLLCLISGVVEMLDIRRRQEGAVAREARMARRTGVPPPAA